MCDLGDFKSTRTRTTHTHLPTGIVEPVTGTSSGSSRRNRAVARGQKGDEKMTRRGAKGGRGLGGVVSLKSGGGKQKVMRRGRLVESSGRGRKEVEEVLVSSKPTKHVSKIMQ